MGRIFLWGCIVMKMIQFFLGIGGIRGNKELLGQQKLRDLDIVRYLEPGREFEWNSYDQSPSLFITRVHVERTGGADHSRSAFVKII